MVNLLSQYHNFYLLIALKGFLKETPNSVGLETGLKGPTLVHGGCLEMVWAH